MGSAGENIQMRGPMPLNIVIVGAGIGGLTAGIALRQSGHSVTILESSCFSQEIGAGLVIAPYCNGVLKRLGIDVARDPAVGGIQNTGINVWPPFAPSPIYVSNAAENQRWEHPRYFLHRGQLHATLREKAVTRDGAGPPCELLLASRVASVDPELGEVVLVSGQRVRGDVVLGADGINSECRKALEGGRGYVPFPCGISAFRFTIPMEVLRADPVTAELLGPRGTLLAGLTVGGVKRLICYPISNSTLLNFVFLHDSAESETTDESPANLKKLVLKVGSDFSSAFQVMLEKVQSEGIKLWTLNDLPTLPTWVNGKMALLGDAAHPFLPHRAEGASQAIEDAVSLGTILMPGTPVEAIPERLALYEKCRKERASTIQNASRIFSQSNEYQKKHGFSPKEFDNYSFSHDEYYHSLHALRVHLKSKRPDIRMRMPLSFGPAAGPCQPGNTIHGVRGSSPADFSPHQIVHTIRFTSSKTFLQNYLPTPAFSFTKPDTVVQASLMCTSFRDLAYLGGHGYERVELRVHGVQHKQTDGTVVKGAFVPIVFENSFDSLVSGREERGAPVVGCDITVTATADGKEITLGWQGTVMGQLQLNGLSKTVSPIPTPAKLEDDGLLMFRFIPAVGNPGGKPDAAYAVFEPSNTPSVKTESSELNGHAKIETLKNGDTLNQHAVKHEGSANGRANGVGAPEEADHDMESTKYASHASFDFTPGKWRSLPTLHHIIGNLQRTPVLEILEGKMEVLRGSDEFSQARRLD